MIKRRLPEGSSGDSGQVLQCDPGRCESVSSLTLFGCHVVIRTIEDAFGELLSGVGPELNIAIDYRSTLLMNLLAEEEEGDCGKLPAKTKGRSTGSKLLVVEEELSDKGPNRGLGRCL